MKREVLPLFLALLLIASPAMGGTSALSDDELASVDAKGFDLPQNNLSVQATGSAMIAASVMSLKNLAGTASNFEQDLDSYDCVSHFVSLSGTFQRASHLGEGIQKATTAGNNGSVQFGGQALSGSGSLSAMSAAGSATNVFQRGSDVSGSHRIAVWSRANQRASNATDNDQTVTNGFHTTTDQNNNNGSVQVTGGAQSQASGMMVNNVAGSASNVSQMVARISGSRDVSLGQSGEQHAMALADDYQNVTNGVARNQTNNNDSVQISGQQATEAYTIGNGAASALNIGQNLIYSADSSNVSSRQKNEQIATSEVGSSQTIEGRVAIGQSNNNESVQISGQSDANGFIMVNVAGSAANVGQNFWAEVPENSPGYGGNVYQKNSQVASNDEAIRIKKADGITTRSEQYIDADAFLVAGAAGQANNNASVQLADGQNRTVALGLSNIADSAVNVGQNVARLSTGKRVEEIEQENVQWAENNAAATQEVTNTAFLVALSLDQVNNNGSVAISGSQNDVGAVSVLNSAISATNVGQNVANLSAAKRIGEMEQKNAQWAENDAVANQTAANSALLAALSLNQVNNNKSVAISGSQNDVRSLSVVNSAASATNVGQNVAAVRKGHIGEAVQGNAQAAANTVGVEKSLDQRVDSEAFLISANAGEINNDGSVQVVGSQNGMSANSLVNTAVSAANVGQNVFSGSANATGEVRQTNAQVALNYDSETTQNVTNGAFAMDTIENVPFLGSIDEALASGVFGQTNNNASVQLINSQRGIQTLSGVNAADSSINVGQNIARTDSSSFVGELNQANLQLSLNVLTPAGQNVYNQATFVEYDRLGTNNNASVQLRSGSQNDASAMSLANIANSAANVGQNVADVSGWGGRTFQLNAQAAVNSALATQSVDNAVAADIFGISESERQTNNNGSVQIGSSQNDASGTSVINAATSTINVGQNIARVHADRSAVVQANAQAATVSNNQSPQPQGVTETLDVLVNPASVIQYVNNYGIGEIERQTNNNGSVQIFGSGSQNRATGMSLANVASSAVNVGQNAASIRGHEANVTQANAQASYVSASVQHQITNVMVETTEPMWDARIEEQTNNDASVQMDDSQNRANADSIVNAAVSAVNIGQNVAKSETGRRAHLVQANAQAAIQEAYASQYVVNDEVESQTNNNMSVVITGSQNDVKALSVANAAGSALNVGQNVASLNGKWEAEIAQLNLQYASSTSRADQGFDYYGDVDGQTNNNASVVITGSQNDVKALSVANAAGSALNVGQNVASAEGREALVAQRNDQTAVVAADGGQLPTFYGDVVVRETSNDGSVVIRGSQNNARALSVANAAISELNVGQNVAAAEGSLVRVYQSNDQTAPYPEAVPAIASSQSAPVSYSEVSTVLAGSQNGVKGLSVVNTTDSLVNIGQNVAKAQGGAVDLNQSNDQVAGFGQQPQALKTVTTEGSASSAGPSSNFYSTRLAGSQNWAESLSIVNTSNTFINVGQNIAKASGGFADVDQSNDQTAVSVGITSAPFAASSEAASINEESVQLVGSQNHAQALSIVNAAAGDMNVGQNIAKVNAGLADVDQYNDQYADPDGAAENFYAVQMIGSQNGTKAGSILNTVGTIGNFGQNIANVGGGFADVDQYNIQSAVYPFFGGTPEGGTQIVDSQNGVSALSLMNGVFMLANVGQNVAKVDADFALVSQSNVQDAGLTPLIGVASAGASDAPPTFNAGGAQLVGSQNEAKGLSLLNGVASSANVGQNVAKANGAFAFVSQYNDQSASFEVPYVGEPAVTPAALSNNVASVQLIDSQNGVHAASILSAALSAVNIGQNVAKANGGRSAVFQVNDQSAYNEEDIAMEVENTRNISSQDNNNGSVQLINSGNDMKVLSAANAAVSAVNVGQNIAEAGGWAPVVFQLNDQYADSYVDAAQSIDNDKKVNSQDNNNVSVQLIDSQNRAKGLSLVNAAGSAVNVGQNIASVSGRSAQVAQANIQEAYGTSFSDQDVTNGKAVNGQNDNNGSVQLTGSQNNASALSILNAAASAVNIGQNIARVTGGRYASVNQYNGQTASNYADGSQDVTNSRPSQVTKQSKNNFNSQIVDSQNNASALSIQNVSGSMMNVGQNLAVVSAPFASVHQMNCQTLVDMTDGDFGTLQMSGTLGGASAMNVVTVYDGLMNVGTNIAKVTGDYACVSQMNVQKVESASSIDAVSQATTGSAKGSGSVVLAGSQSNISGMIVANTIGSSVNFGQNMAVLSGIRGGMLRQVNVQTSTSH